MPKSMTLGRGRPSASVTRTFVGLMSRWTMPLVWACWIASHTSAKSSSRCFEPKPSLIAVFGDGYARHVFHHEVGAAVLAGSRVEYLGDGGVVHEGQGLTLGLEAGQDVP